MPRASLHLAGHPYGRTRYVERLLRCDCGFEVRADDEAELIARVQRHALEVHGMPLTEGEVLNLAVRPDPGEATAPPAEDERGETT